MKKIAVISDIHGNFEALSSVLENIKNHNCDYIFILGDYAMAGPEPKKVVKFFIDKLNDYKYSLIQGNTDFMIANYTDELYKNLKTKAPVMSEALKNDVLLLEESEREFLKNLPQQLEKEVEGVKFLLVHGSPRKNNEDILPSIPLNEVEEMIKNVKADVVLCGHTHIPCGFQTSTKQTVVNVGSVGRPFTDEPKSCYLIITVENGKCLFEHQFVKYDNEKAAQKILQRNFLGVEKLANTLLNPQERHF